MLRSSTPLVSFVIRAGDDIAATHRSLRSCLAQSVSQIEIVYVHTDSISHLAADVADDPRITVLTQPDDTPAAQQRRVGVEASNAPFVLFIEPGDVVGQRAAARLNRRAVDEGAQIVGYAISFSRVGGKNSTSAPVAGPLHDSDVLRQLVPREQKPNLAFWRNLFQTALLRKAYASISTDAGPLVDDRAMTLLAYAHATRYASLDSVEYFRHQPESLEDQSRYEAALNRVDAFRDILPTIRELARFSAEPEPLIDGHAAGHLTAVAESLIAFARLPAEARAREQGRLWEHVDELDAVLAAVAFAPEMISTIIGHGTRLELGGAPVRSVLLTTNVLTTGGVSGVLLTQARFLLEAGYRVTIVTHRSGSTDALVPDGATLVQLTGTTRRQRVAQWARLCRTYDVDIVIDHRILYSRDWPAFALGARATGAATIGWIHNFAGRPTYNGNDLQTVLRANLGALAHLVVLSPLDVAFWKLVGIPHVSYLPNPPSPFLLNVGPARVAKSAPRDRALELIWWGRLEEHTKKMSQLIEVGASLQRMGVDFRLRIVGPDWADMTAERLMELASKRGVADRVEATGPLHGADLLEAIDSSDVFVNTSIIEGYPLTLPEAQSRGLPLVMYDLPWLSLIQDNAGVITTPQQVPDDLATAVAALATDPQRYEAMSAASIAAAARASSSDFAQLYEQLLHGDLSPELSPEPTIEDGRKILDLLVFFAERSTPPPHSATTRSLSRQRKPPWDRAPLRAFARRVERDLTPIGHRIVDAAPWLRPVASRIKRALLRR